MLPSPSTPEKSPEAKYAIVVFAPTAEEGETAPNSLAHGREGVFRVLYFSLEYVEADDSESEEALPPILSAVSHESEKRIRCFNFTGSTISTTMKCRADWNYQLQEWMILGIAGAEVVGEMGLTTTGISAITAVAFSSLSDEVKAAIDPEGILAVLDTPRVFELGVEAVDRYRIWKVNSAAPEDPPVFKYYGTPVYDGDPENPSSLTPQQFLAANMLGAIGVDYLLQTKAIGSDKSTAEAMESSGYEGGFGSNPPSASVHYATIESVVSGIIDVVSCSPAPEAVNE